MDVHTVTHVTNLFAFYSGVIRNAVHTGVFFLKNKHHECFNNIIKLSLISFIMGTSYYIGHICHTEIYLAIYLFPIQGHLKIRYISKHTSRQNFLDIHHFLMVNSETQGYRVVGYVLFHAFDTHCQSVLQRVGISLHAWQHRVLSLDISPCLFEMQITPLLNWCKFTFRCL